ncbi:MAG: Glyoxalase-like domain [Paenibacillus sp.]|jgi:predicted enzyme related to lactoylglutathione lyase|nr:Glyoxalase-like domain [Paenibacillus sp.]
MEQTARSVIENRIAEVCIRVENYPKVEPFYRDFLGLPLAWGNGQCIGYFDMQGTGILIVQDGQAKPKSHESKFAIASRDIDADYEIMSNAGVTVSDIVTHGNGQRQFNIADPEGNILTLIKYKYELL